MRLRGTKVLLPVIGRIGHEVRKVLLADSIVLPSELARGYVTQRLMQGSCSDVEGYPRVGAAEKEAKKVNCGSSIADRPIEIPLLRFRD